MKYWAGKIINIKCAEKEKFKRKFSNVMRKMNWMLKNDKQKIFMKERWMREHDPQNKKNIIITLLVQWALFTVQKCFQIYTRLLKAGIW